MATRLFTKDRGVEVSVDFPGPVFVNHCPDDVGWCREFVTYLTHAGIGAQYHDFHLDGITVTTSKKPDLAAFPVFIAVLSPEFLSSPERRLVSEASLLETVLNSNHALHPDEYPERLIFLVVARKCNVPPVWQHAWRTYRLVQGNEGRGLDPHEAAARVLRELRTNRTNPKYQANRALGRALELIRMNRGEEALEAIEQAITFQPESSYYWVHKAKILDRLDRVKEALDALAVAQTIDPQNAYNWSAMGSLWVNRGRFAEAAAAFKVATSLAPTEANLWTLLGNVLLLLKDPSQALNAFDEALALDHRNESVWVSKSIALPQLGREDESRAAMQHSKDVSSTK